MQLTKLISGIKKVIFFSLGMTIWHSVGIAADYYVSPAGTASWDECTSINTPCSLQTSGANAVAGDTVYLRGGTYVLPFSKDTEQYWKMGFQPVNSGSAGNPITFKAYQDETPFLDNAANAGQENPVASYGVRYKDYIIFDGLDTKSELSNGLSRAVVVNRTTGTVVRNADIQAVNGAAGNNSAIRVEDANNCTIENNILHGAHQSGGAQHNSAAYMLYDSDHITVQNNTIYDSDCALFDKQGGNHNTYRYNFIYNCEWGIQHSSTGPPTGNLHAYQNVFVNIVSWAYENAGNDSDPSNDILFYNNTIYNSNGAETTVTSDNGITGFEYFNNINFSVGTAMRYEADDIGYMDHNLYFSTGGLPSSPFDSNSKTSDPGFVNIGGITPEDYKTTSYSQDGRGGSYPLVMGAYISGNEVIGYSGDDATEPPPADDIVVPQDFKMEPNQ